VHRIHWPEHQITSTRCGTDIEDWMCAVEFSDLPALHSLVRGRHKDLDACVAVLSLPRSACVSADSALLGAD
jgi:hypothetical protein